MPDQLHTIRFKRDGIEFELTGSQADVQKAWTALEGSIVSAFEAMKSSSRSARTPTQELPEREAPRRTTRRRGRTQTGARGGGAETRQALMAATIDDFPELPSEPPALYAGYATLDWARRKLEIDALTVPDIQAFLSERLRVPHTAAAYRNAFRTRQRAVHRSTTSPHTYRLMQPGEAALKAYFKSVAEGATASEAEERAAEAEEKEAG